MVWTWVASCLGQHTSTCQGVSPRRPLMRVWGGCHYQWQSFASQKWYQHHYLHILLWFFGLPKGWRYGMHLANIASEIVAWVLGRCWYTNIYIYIHKFVLSYIYLLRCCLKFELLSPYIYIYMVGRSAGTHKSIHRTTNNFIYMMKFDLVKNYYHNVS